MKDIENSAANAAASLREEDQRLKGARIDANVWRNPNRDPLDFAKGVVALPGGIMANI